MVAILFISSVLIMKGKDLFKHGMNVSCASSLSLASGCCSIPLAVRVGATVGANVVAFIVLMYTGAITGFLAQFSQQGTGAGFGATCVLAYCAAVSHFIFGCVLFWHRDHAMPGDAAAEGLSRGDQEPILPQATPPPAAPPPASAAAASPYTPPQPIFGGNQPRAQPVDDNPWL